jgi:hypothetical protein
MLPGTQQHPVPVYLRFTGAWVSDEQHVALPPDVCARVVSPRAAADEGDGHSQLHQEQAVNLQDTFNVCRQQGTCNAPSADCVRVDAAATGCWTRSALT